MDCWKCQSSSNRSCVGTEWAKWLDKTVVVLKWRASLKINDSKNSSVETKTSSTKAIQGIHFISNKGKTNKFDCWVRHQLTRVFYFPTSSVMPLINWFARPRLHYTLQNRLFDWCLNSLDGEWKNYQLCTTTTLRRTCLVGS